MNRLTSLCVAMLGLSLSGCFKIVDTAGLQAAYTDAFIATANAQHVKSMTNLPDDKRQAAAAKYDAIAARINAYLQSAIDQASDFRVEEPAERYTGTGTSQLVAAFERDVSSLAGPTPQSVTATVAVGLAVEGVKVIKALNDEAQKQAYDRFATSVSENKMKSFTDVPISPSSTPNR
ncbi:MAG: hypothetical protein JWM57_514 [Phycisphaerales bacterium]|nr:hypothetical protein [Phycisphaerales bacterium]